MSRLKERVLRGPVVALVIALTAVVAAAAPAAAHTPVRLDPCDVVPWRGPMLLDGQGATFLFGTLNRPLDTRAARLRMTAGQQVEVSLSVPNLAPENQLPDWALPFVLLKAPDGALTVIRVRTRTPIQTESGLDLLILSGYSTVAETGVYKIVVTGLRPARFGLSTGVEGVPFGGVDNGEVATPEQIREWYTTPPGRTGAGRSQERAPRAAMTARLIASR